MVVRVNEKCVCSFSFLSFFFGYLVFLCQFVVVFFLIKGESGLYFFYFFILILFLFLFVGVALVVSGSGGFWFQQGSCVVQMFVLHCLSFTPPATTTTTTTTL